MLTHQNRFRSFSLHVFTPFGVLYVLLFFYILLIIDPSLYYQCRLPVFLTDTAFLKNYINYPGGLADYISNLLSQLYYFPFWGSVIVWLCLFAVVAASQLFRKLLALGKSQHLHYIPLLIMLMMFSQYEHSLASTLALLSAVYSFIFYLRFRPKLTVLCALMIILQSMLIYYFSAGFLLLFALLCLLYEVFYQRSLMLGLLAVAVAFYLPYFSQKHLFILTQKAAYLYLLLPAFEYHPKVTPLLMFAYFPLLVVLTKWRFWKNFRNPLVKLSPMIKFAVLVVLTLLTAVISFDRTMNTVLRVDRYAEHRRWESLLKFVRRHPCDDLLVAFHTNRALAHTNRLSSEMFSYNQNWGASGLYLPPEARKFFSLQTVDLYLDLGFLNEAQHWILEDHTRFENNPRHLQRLALINIVQGDSNLARMALNNLDKTVLYKSWADHYRSYLDEPSRLANDRYLQSILAKQVAHDFIVNPVLPGRDIEAIIANKPTNRLAFEYLMADYILTFRLAEFMDQLKSIEEFKYARLPRHYQEAVLVFIHNTPEFTTLEIEKNIDIPTRRDFLDFMRILTTYQGNALDAQKDLKIKYGHTYWYYSLYNNPQIRAKTAN